MKNVTERQIPIIAIDRWIKAPANMINQTIASNNVKGANEIAKWFLTKYPQAKNNSVFHLGGVQGAEAAIDRSKGFKEGFGEEFLTTEVANFNKAEALEKTNIILQSRGNEFKTIFADNDEMALGAITSIQSKNYQAISTIPYDSGANKYYVLGFDGTDEALSAIKNGQMAATVIQQPALMGTLSIKSAVNILNGKVVDKVLDAVTIVVSKDNVDKFLN